MTSSLATALIPPPSVRSSRCREAWWWRAALLCGALCLLCGALVYQVSLRWLTERHDAQLAQRLQAEVARVEHALGKYETLPDVLSLDPRLRAALLSQEEQAIAAANEFLREAARRSDVALLYLLDQEGVVRASSWAGTVTPLIGERYGFRAYFQAAQRGGRGRLYARGLTSGNPGYFMSAPLRSGGAPQGVVVAKISLDHFEREWALMGDLHVALEDDRGVVVLSSTPGWRFHPLQVMTRAMRDLLGKERRYGAEPLAALDTAPLGELHLARALPHQGYRLHLFADRRALRAEARTRALLFGALLAVLTLLWSLRAQKRWGQHLVQALLAGQERLRATQREQALLLDEVALA